MSAVQADCGDEERRQLVTLSYTHARDADLQLAIASDDARICAAVAGGSYAVELADPAGSCADSALPSAMVAPLRSLSRPAATVVATGGHGASADTPADAAVQSSGREQDEGTGWLERMRQRDAELQARIAAQDGAVQRAYRS
jgi:hypothetical protein